MVPDDRGAIAGSVGTYRTHSYPTSTRLLAARASLTREQENGEASRPIASCCRRRVAAKHVFLKQGSIRRYAGVIYSRCSNSMWLEFSWHNHAGKGGANRIPHGRRHASKREEGPGVGPGLQKRACLGGTQTNKVCLHINALGCAWELSRAHILGPLPCTRFGCSVRFSISQRYLALWKERDCKK